MTTSEKNTRVGAIVCHLYAIADKCPRPEIHAMEDLAQATAESLLGEAELLFSQLQPGNAGVAALLISLREAVAISQK